MLSFFRWLFSGWRLPVDPPKIVVETSAAEQFEALADIEPTYNLRDNYIRIGRDPAVRTHFKATIAVEARGDMRPEKDFVVQSNRVELVVARKLARALDKTTISFVDEPYRRGFKFEGPSFFDSY